MNIKNIYLKGNTIIEVLIALAISAFSIGIAMMIYVNLQKSSLPFLKIKALELAEGHMKQTFNDHAFYEEVYPDEAFIVKKTVDRHALFNDCYVVTMRVFDMHKKQVYELEAIYLEHNQ